MICLNLSDAFVRHFLNRCRCLMQFQLCSRIMATCVSVITDAYRILIIKTYFFDRLVLTVFFISSGFGNWASSQ